jgi:lipopolysaccharide/colanic/teichoic acid biosynthesis glycosyltransferase
MAILGTLRIYQRLIKRMIDLSASLVFLLILGPLLFVIGIAIMITDFGPPLYLGSRVGRNGKEFKICKFRTMQLNAESFGPSSTSLNDPRITAVGGFLRSTKLDELPQLWNVFRGQMSLVGPRPQVKWAVEMYTALERKILLARPGISDYASLVYRDEAVILAASTDPDADYLRLIAPGKLRLGVEYVENIGFYSDFRILLATLLTPFGVDPIKLFPSHVREISTIEL